ncbi:permease [Paenibacillus sp. YPG26]|uniref:permease n=1 Tax=Paenibacillus sp. YPG26 TaxID=2878915 RepID=UPI00204141EF|nr:permease [Paenibacillus sp. YPG26]USB31880.1 permease [Paenibacillus sp. YPG26]
MRNFFFLPKYMAVLLPFSFMLVCVIIFAPSGLSLLNSEAMATFKNIFNGIFLESIPFVLAGALLSSILHLTIPEHTISRWIPKNPLLAILFACSIGIVFPICECGMVPLVRRLIQKGMPVYMAMVFILAGPILNPVVFGSTYTAFRTHPEIAYARMGLALLVSISIGVILYLTLKESPLRLSNSDKRNTSITGHQHHPVHLRNHEHHHSKNRFMAVLVHSADELFGMGKYLILGCLLTAGIQTMVAKESLTAIGGHPLGAYAFMMGFSFLLSLCSTSDAFVASTFLPSFSTGSLLAFLILGPMLDFKNFMMLLAAFKARFVLFFMFLVLSLVFIFSFLGDQLIQHLN